MRSLGQLNNAESFKVYPVYLFPFPWVLVFYKYLSSWVRISFHSCKQDKTYFHEICQKVLRKLKYRSKFVWNILCSPVVINCCSDWLENCSMGGNCSITARSRKHFFYPQAGGCLTQYSFFNHWAAQQIWEGSRWRLNLWPPDIKTSMIPITPSVGHKTTFSIFSWLLCYTKAEGWYLELFEFIHAI